MKKIYTLMMAAAVAAPALWASDMTAPQRVASGLDCTSHNLYDLLTAPGMKGADRVKQQKAPGGVPTLIWELPETATAEVMERDAAGYYEAASQAYLSNVSGISVTIYTDGNDVYMPNVSHMFTAGAYLKGTKGEDRMSFPLPQAVYSQTSNTGLTQTVGYYYMTVLRFNEQAQWYLEDTNDTSLDLVLNADNQYAYDCQGYTTIKNDLTGASTDFPNRIIGIVDEAGDWVGYGDYYYRIYPFVGEKTAAPASTENAERHIFTYGYTGHHIDIVKDGSDIYIQGLSRYLPEAWVKGTIDGDKVTLPSDQYLGIAPFMGYFAYMNGFKTTKVLNPNTGTHDLDIQKLDAMEFVYDAEKGTLTGSSELCISGGRQAKAYLEYFYEPKISTVPEVSSYVPMTPVIGTYYNMKPGQTHGRIDFEVPTLSEAGDLLTPENIEWCFLVDGDSFALDPADYLKLKEEMEWIPYYFYDGFDITWSGTLHRLYFFIEAPETLGIQTRYTDDDGNVYYSEKATVDAALKVNKVEADHGEVISTACYDMTGARVTEDTRGLIIKIERYADGFTKATKSIR